MGKKIKKIVKKIVKLDPVHKETDKFLDSMGLPNLIGESQGMLTQDDRDSAAKRQAEIDEAERRRMQAQAEQAQRDANADLRNMGVADVQIGAGADLSTGAMQKKRQGTTLSQAIGLRV